tara:strand:+ start:57 stop:407 length:351 start_codon:yes stop_codon:yes gene_type:complete
MDRIALRTAFGNLSGTRLHGLIGVFQSLAMVRRYPLKERRRSSAMSDNSEIKWEYHVQGVKGLARYVNAREETREASAELNHLGEEGWELVGFYDADAFFKRRMASKDDAQSLFEE